MEDRSCTKLLAKVLMPLDPENGLLQEIGSLLPFLDSTPYERPITTFPEEVLQETFKSFEEGVLLHDIQAQQTQEERRRERQKKERRIPSELLRQYFLPLVVELSELAFEGLEGNPFVELITKENAKSKGVSEDYFSVVTQVMSLSLVKERLNRLRYKSVREFVSDVDLVIENSLSYNFEGDPVHNATLKLKEAFQESFAKAERDLNVRWQGLLQQYAASRG